MNRWLGVALFNAMFLVFMLCCYKNTKLREKSLKRSVSYSTFSFFLPSGSSGNQVGDGQSTAISAVVTTPTTALEMNLCPALLACVAILEEQSINGSNFLRRVKTSLPSTVDKCRHHQIHHAIKIWSAYLICA